MLTAIQIEVAQIINKVEGRELFVLAGGGALILKEVSIRETEESELGPTLTNLELGANKVLALSGRSKARDGFNLHAISKIVNLDQAIKRAPEIDLAIFS